MKKTLVLIASALFLALFVISCNDTQEKKSNEESQKKESKEVDESNDLDSNDNVSNDFNSPEDSSEEYSYVDPDEEGDPMPLTSGIWVNNELGSTTTYQFTDDGKCTIIRPDPFEGGIDTIVWKYTLDGETMKLEQKGKDFSMSKEMKVSIKGNKLTITEAGVPMEYKWQAAE